MKDLLSYHQRLVEEKGLPPSRLMEQHAADSASSNQSPGRKEKLVKCDQCEFSSVSQRSLKVHVRRSHKGQQADEILREDEEVEVTLNPLTCQQGGVQAQHERGPTQCGDLHPLHLHMQGVHGAGVRGGVLVFYVL